MAGHSQFKNIMHRKGRQDAVRSKIFSKLAREITVAAKAGLPDPTMNPRLRLAIQNAKAQSMPKDNIDRAIKKASGGEGENYDEVRYEGYGPGGVAFVVKATTDNKQRTSQDVRAIFTRHGGNLAGSGAVSFQFLHAGQFLIAKDKTTEDRLLEVALDAGADDVITSDDGFEVRCPISAFDKVAHALEHAGIPTDSAEIAYIPTTFVPVTDVGVAKTLLTLHELLEGHDDVQQVFSNEEMDDAISAAANG